MVYSPLTTDTFTHSLGRMTITAPQLTPQYGKIIVLNGTSSAGKSSLAKAMQVISTLPLHHVQLDAFRAMEPPGYWDHWEVEGPAVADRKMAALCCAMHAAVLQYSLHGQQTILDVAITNAYARQLFVEDLKDSPVYLIGVHCSKEELAKRELARGDRKVGLAGSQIDWIHKRMRYDLQLDTTGRTPDDVAKEILAWLATDPERTALNETRAMLNAVKPIAQPDPLR